MIKDIARSDDKDKLVEIKNLRHFHSRKTCWFPKKLSLYEADFPSEHNLLQKF